jgi:hypothetical protein
MGTNKNLASLQDLVPNLSGAYSCHYSLACVWTLHFKLLAKFVSSCLESIKQQMHLVEMKMTYYCGPLANPSWSALMLRAPSSPPVSRKQLLNRLHYPYP